MKSLIKKIITNRTTGEISMPPKLGKNLLIGFNKGFVSLSVAYNIIETNLLYVFRTPNAVSQLKITFNNTINM
tara:strand:+ start:1097 stop:1315 length:219 start_codon:yes stop_codon:yes gene_type:complete